jgi:hypothetical protein
MDLDVATDLPVHGGTLFIAGRIVAVVPEPASAVLFLIGNSMMFSADARPCRKLIRP